MLLLRLVSCLHNRRPLFEIALFSSPHTENLNELIFFFIILSSMTAALFASVLYMGIIISNLPLRLLPVLNCSTILAASLKVRSMLGHHRQDHGRFDHPRDRPPTIGKKLQERIGFPLFNLVRPILRQAFLRLSLTEAFWRRPQFCQQIRDGEGFKIVLHIGLLFGSLRLAGTGFHLSCTASRSLSQVASVLAVSISSCAFIWCCSTSSCGFPVYSGHAC